MKSVSALCILVLLLAVPAMAQNNGKASNGNFQFSLEGASGSIQYDARLQGTAAKGQMTFTGAAAISNEDLDGEGASTSSLSNVTMTVTFNCLRVEGNKAAMSGNVTSSSVPAYIGMRAVLAVEDNGEGVNEGPDRFTWGLYRTVIANWTPEDSEVPGDNGASLSWFVTDSERFDDNPVPSRPAASFASNSVDCKSFPFGSYAFEEIPHGAGNLQVKP